LGGQLALQNGHLLAKGEDLPVTIITEKAGSQGGELREQYNKQVPEHAGRMTKLKGEVNTGIET